MQGLWPGLLRQQPGPRLRLPGERQSTPPVALLPAAGWQHDSDPCHVQKADLLLMCLAVYLPLSVIHPDNALPMQGHIKYTDAVLNNSKGALSTSCLLESHPSPCLTEPITLMGMPLAAVAVTFIAALHGVSSQAWVLQASHGPSSRRSACTRRMQASSGEPPHSPLLVPTPHPLTCIMRLCVFLFPGSNFACIAMRQVSRVDVLSGHSPPSLLQEAHGVPQWALRGSQEPAPGAVLRGHRRQLRVLLLLDVLPGMPSP